MTMEMWLTASGGNNAYNRLFQLGTSSTVDTSSIALCLHGGSNSVVLATWLAGHESYASNIGLNSIAGNAYVVAVFDPVVSSTMKTYINGVQVASGALSLVLPGSTECNYTGRSVIGGPGHQ